VESSHPNSIATISKELESHFQNMMIKMSTTIRETIIESLRPPKPKTR